MNTKCLVDQLLEATDARRAALIAKLGPEGYELVDEAKAAGYDLMLWRGRNTRNSQPITFYEMSLSHLDLNFVGPEAQAGKQAGGSMHLLGQKAAMIDAVNEWLDRFGTIYVGSLDERKLKFYHRIIPRLMPDLKVSKLFPAFDDSEQPDYFTITGYQPQLAVETLQRVLGEALDPSDYLLNDELTALLLDLGYEQFGGTVYLRNFKKEIQTPNVLFHVCVGGASNKDKSTIFGTGYILVDAEPANTVYQAKRLLDFKCEADPSLEKLKRMDQMLTQFTGDFAAAQALLAQEDARLSAASTSEPQPRNETLQRVLGF